MPQVTMIEKPSCFHGRSPRIMSSIGISISVQPRRRRSVMRINPPNVAMHARCVDRTIGYTYDDSRTAVKTLRSWMNRPIDAIVIAARLQVNE
jgi:hypothetical protein